MFTAYCRTLHNIEAQLLSMFGDTDGKTDLLLRHLSAAVSGGYYYAPSVERLQNLCRTMPSETIFQTAFSRFTVNRFPSAHYVCTHPSI